MAFELKRPCWAQHSDRQAVASYCLPSESSLPEPGLSKHIWSAVGTDSTLSLWAQGLHSPMDGNMMVKRKSACTLQRLKHVRSASKVQCFTNSLPTSNSTVNNFAFGFCDSTNIFFFESKKWNIQSQDAATSFTTGHYGCLCVMLGDLCFSEWDVMKVHNAGQAVMSNELLIVSECTTLSNHIKYN